MTPVQEPADRPGPGAALVLAALWVSVLVLLAIVWVRSPFSGPGPMFGVWSGVAVPLSVWTLSRVRRWKLTSVPAGGGVVAAAALIWAVAAWAAASTRPALWSLDGFILRDPTLRILGAGLQWLPGFFGLALSAAGLAIALEARYRLARPSPSGGSGAGGPAPG